jgi:hypothetical protein
MRRKSSFLLTIFSTGENDDLRGRIQYISNGKTATFTNLKELDQLIRCDISSLVNSTGQFLSLYKFDNNSSIFDDKLSGLKI